MSEVTQKMENAEVARKGWSRNRKILTWGIVAGLVLSTGGATAAIAVTNYKAETKRLCDVAVAGYKSTVTDDVDVAKEAAAKSLAASQDKAIQKLVPGAVAYSARAEVKADTKKNIEARPAAKTLINDVQARVDAVADASGTMVCVSRDDAKAITSTTRENATAAEDLTGAVQVLDADVATFVASEKKRIAAEKKAAAEKAEAEAAAAQAAAEQAAAEQAAAETYYEPPTYTDNGGGGGGGNTWTPPAPDPGNGGGGGGGEWTPPDNGERGCPPGVNCHV